MAPVGREPDQLSHKELDRAAFTQGVIKALIAKELQPQPHPTVLAQSALNSLQYDYPLISVLELDALSEQLRDAVQISKERQTLVTGITHQLISNATSAVLSASKTGPQQNKQQKEPETSATTNQASHTDGHVTANISLLSSSHTSNSTLAAAYQRLCTVLFLQYVNTLLNVPVPDSWSLLSRYSPPELSQSDSSSPPQKNDIASSGNVADQAIDQHAAMMKLQEGNASTNNRLHNDQHVPNQPNGNTNSNQESHGSGSKGGVELDDVEAEQQDEDDMEYEPLEGPVTNNPNSVAATGMNQQNKLYTNGLHYTFNTQAAHATDSLTLTSVQPDALWQEVKQKLVHLCSQYHLSALAVPMTQPAMEPQHDIPSHASKQQSSRPGISSSSAAAAKTASGGMRLNTKPVTNGLQTLPNTGSTAISTIVDSKPTNHAAINRLHLIWERPEVQECLFQLIRSLGVHSQSSDLQPILRSYLSLVVEWCEHKPEILEHLLSQVWDALGVSSIASMPRSMRCRTGSRGSSAGLSQPNQACQILLPEADMCLGMVLQLILKLPHNSQGRGAVWRCVHAHLLPVLKHCLSDIAAADRSQTEAAAAALDAVCKVLIFYIEDAPGGSRPAESLQQTGVLGALCAMFVNMSASASAEQLSTALLLCAASSPSIRDWILAVPGIKQTVTSSAEFNYGGKLQHHGLVWHTLLSQQVHRAPSKIPQDDAGNQDQQMVDLLQGATSNNIIQVQAASSCLQLMTSVNRVCRGGVRWSRKVQEGMQETFAQLKQRTSGSGTSNIPDTSRLKTDIQVIDSCKDRIHESDMDVLHEGHSLVPLDELKLKQLHSTCVAALMSLLTEGSKAD